MNYQCRNQIYWKINRQCSSIGLKKKHYKMSPTRLTPMHNLHKNVYSEREEYVQRFNFTQIISVGQKIVEIFNLYHQSSVATSLASNDSEKNLKV